jgi:hypothetical protein
VQGFNELVGGSLRSQSGNSVPSSAGLIDQLLRALRSGCYRCYGGRGRPPGRPFTFLNLVFSRRDLPLPFRPKAPISILPKSPVHVCRLACRGVCARERVCTWAGGDVGAAREAVVSGSLRQGGLHARRAVSGAPLEGRLHNVWICVPEFFCEDMLHVALAFVSWEFVF